jgi:hypothetical protein
VDAYRAGDIGDATKFEFCCMLEPRRGPRLAEVGATLSNANEPIARLV